MKSGTTSKKIPKKIASKVESIFDAEKRIVDEGKKMFHSNDLKEAEMIKNGYRWKTIMGDRGIKLTKLIKD